ncbi:MAG: phenylalanine--tRNA ligase subunit beta [Deltaproteobacteria bacterium]|jgi:phenylalanyl-tRNA synthetase beta chain|nr:phenylalanine--tRNA ligase subunit beta [Deltaproteobacteria bacterium]
MLASVSWLGEYIDISDLDPQAVAETLTMAGLEVEDLRDRLAFMDKVVAAKVVSSEDHGRFRLLTVDAGGDKRFEVIGGDPLVSVGSIYPLALPGANLPAGPVKEKVVSGFSSRGVLCSEMELGLSADASKVMPLGDNAIPGQSLRELIGQSDWVLEISVTPNRADALCMVGVARDLGAVLGRGWTGPKTVLIEGRLSAFDQIAVSIESPEHCIRYTGRVINSLRPGPSPAWMARRLFAAGLRPISNLVDVTNYVMLETGLPLHAFDLRKLAGPAIIVRAEGPGGKFVTLDGQERTLKSEKTVLICDAERAVGLGGIMGGLNTEVDEATRDVFLEAACFNPVTIRKASRALGLSTDASYRFERGQDPNQCHLAVDRAAQMMAELAGGSVASGRLDAYPKLVRPKKTTFSPARCNALLGTNHSPAAMERVLRAVGVELSKMGEGEYEASLPTFRPDLLREVDLYEEVVRLVDFQNLPATLPRPSQPAQEPPPPYRLRAKLRAVLSGLGWAEHVGYSFINRDFADKLGLGADHVWRTGAVEILNPLSEDQGILRPSLLPGLLDAAKLNQYHGQWDVALFETGAVFRAASPKPLEFQRLGGVISGSLGGGHWCQPKRPADFWDVKGVVEALGQYFGLSLAFEPESGPLGCFLDPAQAARIYVNGRLSGLLGRLSGSPAKSLGFKEAGGDVFLFEMDIDDLPVESRKPFQPWSSYPGVVRDLALVVDKSLPAAELRGALSGRQKWPIASVTVFDLYQGDQVPPGKKSLALRIMFQDFGRTLTDELVNGYFNEIVATMAEHFGAELRG